MITKRGVIWKAFTFLVFTLMMQVNNASVDSYYQNLEAGTGTSGNGADGIAATSSGVNNPQQVFYSTASGITGLLIADYSNYRIRRVDSDGIVSKFAGSSSPTATSDGLAATSFYFRPYGLCMDSSGAVLSSDTNGHKVYKFALSGYLSSTLAGTGTASGSTTANGDNGPATSATLNYPALIHSQYLITYVPEYSGHKIRAISSTGIITTVAGTGISAISGVSGPATQSTLASPAGVFCDTSNRLYLTEEVGYYIKVVSSGIISVIAGTGVQGYSGDGGQATAAQIDNVDGIFGDSVGRIFIGEYNIHRVRAIDTNGIISTIFGTGSYVSVEMSGIAATSSSVKDPVGVHIDTAGNIHIGDNSGHNVRRLFSVSPTTAPSAAPGRTVDSYYQSLEAGSSTGSSTDGIAATSSTLETPEQVFYSTASGISGLLIADGHSVRRVGDDGIITKFAGSTLSTATSNGLAATSFFFSPNGLCMDSSGAVLSTDLFGHKIFKFASSGYLSYTLAGNGSPGSTGDNGPATSATVHNPYFLHSPSLTVFVGDSGSNKVRSISSSGIISTIAGNGENTISGVSGPATQATLSAPSGVFLDSTNRLYITEQNGYYIKAITSGIISVVAGTGVQGYGGDGGPATSAVLNNVFGIFVDTVGRVYFADVSHRVRAIDTFGIISTIFGTGDAVSAPLSGVAATSSSVNDPSGIHGDSTGNLHVSDDYWNNVRRLYYSPTAMPSIGPTFNPSVCPSNAPTLIPSTNPSISPTVGPSVMPTNAPTVIPSIIPSLGPSVIPSQSPVGHTVDSFYQSLEAGTGVSGRGADGVAATSSALNRAFQVFYSVSASIYGLLIADYGNNRIRRVDINGIVSQFAGSGSPTDTSDGLAATSFYFKPIGVCMDSSGAVISSYFDSHKVFKFSPNGYLSSTLAGTGAASGSSVALNGDNGPATSATFNLPFLLHSQSSITYVPDYLNHRVRAISASGIITTVAGTGVDAISSVSGSAATQSSIVYPAGVFCDTSNRLYITEEAGYFVKVVSSGIISVVAGTGVAGFSGDGGPATAAQMNKINGIYADTVGRIFICEIVNNKVRAIDTFGIISTVFGTGSVLSVEVSGIAATSSSMNKPSGIHVDSAGFIHVGQDNGHNVRRLYSVSPTIVPTAIPTVSLLPSTIPSIAPTVLPSTKPSAIPSVCPSVGPSVNPSVVPSAAPTVLPSTKPTVIPSICPSVGPSVNPSATPSNVPTVLPSINPTTSPSNSPSVVPSTLLTASPSVLPSQSPVGHVVDNFYQTLEAGTGAAASGADGISATSSDLCFPYQLFPSTVVGLSGLLIADFGSYRIRRVGEDGVITKFAGSNSGSDSDGVAATSFSFGPVGLSMDSAGAVVSSNYGGHKVVKFTAGGYLSSTLAGTGTASTSTLASNGDNGPATSAALNYPYLLHSQELITYIADAGNFRVRAVSASGIITTVAGTGIATESVVNGPATQATLAGPSGVFCDSTNRLYISEQTGYFVKRVSSGIISVVAGTGVQGYSGDGGQATSAHLNIIYGIFVDTVGRVYLGEYAVGRVRAIDTFGIINSIFGTGGSVTTIISDIAASISPLNSPIGIHGDSAGNIHVADDGGSTVRRLYSVSPTALPTPSPSVSSLPSMLPSISPSCRPTVSPSVSPSTSPSCQPTQLPNAPTVGPSVSPTLLPSLSPSCTPSKAPTVVPSVLPSQLPSIFPTLIPSAVPSVTPSIVPTLSPSVVPTVSPSVGPSFEPSFTPSLLPTVTPTIDPTRIPSLHPSITPTVAPSQVPTIIPSVTPSLGPSVGPSIGPSIAPTALPTVPPSFFPTVYPSGHPSEGPSCTPSLVPSFVPSVSPSMEPTLYPTAGPSTVSSIFLTIVPTLVTSLPSLDPSPAPSDSSSLFPTLLPTVDPSGFPTVQPSLFPTQLPSPSPSTAYPSVQPSVKPTLEPTVAPSVGPSTLPSERPSITPSLQPTLSPSSDPSRLPSRKPSVSPSVIPSRTPSAAPSMNPSVAPTLQLPTVSRFPTAPTIKPSKSPSKSPSLKPSRDPTLGPSVKPTVAPTVKSTLVPTQPTLFPTLTFQPSVSDEPTIVPSINPSQIPSMVPTIATTLVPTIVPSALPSQFPSSASPTTSVPSAAPSTAEFYAGHPRATLPSNQSISVIGPDFNFKIVLPFLTMSSGPFGTAFNNIALTIDQSMVSFLISGDSSLPSALTVASGVSYSGSGCFDTSKRSAAVLGDVNDDGHNDLIIGDPYASRCYVLFGTAQMTNMTQGFTIFGESEGDLTGWSVSGAGDVNNDTIADIILGAPNVNGVGAFYVVYGRRFNNFDVYLNNLTASQGFVMYGAQKSDYLGISVANAGDVNGDKCDDIIVGGVKTASYFAGLVYAVFGGRSMTSLTSISMLGSQGYRLSGVSYSFSGYSVSAAGDVNKDGLADFLVGSSPQKSSLPLTAYLIYGSKAISEEVSLSGLTSSQGARITGGGMTVSYVGDINHDGSADILIGGNLVGVSSVLTGYIIYSNVSHMTRQTSQPSVIPTYLPVFAPTLNPSRLPSRVPLAPSVIPSKSPSVGPTLTPTAPSVFPTLGVSQPSSRPTAQPSRPTIAPSETPTESPTVQPSESPSESPTLRPSEPPSELPTVQATIEPSIFPTVEPSASPSTLFPSVVTQTRAPFSIPSAKPSSHSNFTGYTSYYIGGSSVVSNQSEGYQNYIVNTSESVSIYNLMGHNKYSLFPNSGSKLTILFLNSSTDVIDLTAFTIITAFKQLLISEGSVILTLPNEQVVHILNLHPVDISAGNFILYQQPKQDNEKKGNKTLSVVAGCLIAIGGLILGTMLLLQLCGNGVHWFKSGATLQGSKDHFLMVVKYTTEGELVVEKEESVTNDDIESCLLDEFSITDSTNLSKHTINSDGVWVNRAETASLNEQRIEDDSREFIHWDASAMENDVTRQQFLAWSDEPSLDGALVENPGLSEWGSNYQQQQHELFIHNQQKWYEDSRETVQNDWNFDEAK